MVEERRAPNCKMSSPLSMPLDKDSVASVGVSKVCTKELVFIGYGAQYNTPLSLLAKKIWLVKRQIKRKKKGLLTRRHRASPQTQSGPAAGLRYVEEQTSAGYVRVLHHLESKNPTSSLADICSAGRGSRAHVANYSHRVPRCGQASRTIGCRADRTAAEVRASPAVRS